MMYDLIRWGFGVLIFVILLLILCATTHKKGKSALISAFVAIILSSILFFYPVENLFYSFSSVPAIFGYRHNENLLTFAECDSGVLCVGTTNNANYVYYTFNKVDDGYKLMQKDSVNYRSSKFGIYIFGTFDDETIIMTLAEGSSFGGTEFLPAQNNYYYTIIKGTPDLSKLECKGERVSLV